MALLRANIAFDAREIALRDKPAEMVRASPKATVPVLVLPDGKILDESLEIMRWAFDGRDTDGWWQRGQVPAARELIATTDGPFKLHLDRYKYPERYPAAEDARTHRDQAVAGLLLALDSMLESRPFVGGDAPCAADIAIFPFVRQFRAVDQRWFDALPLHAIHPWLQGWLDSDLFQRCMTKSATGSTTRF